MAKYLAQVIVLGAQVVGRAFARALQQEYVASRAAAQHGTNSASGGRAQALSNAKMGITVQESCDILNVDKELEAEQIAKSYEHLFSVNDKSKGGSFYIQSKVVRAKERLDEELKIEGERKQVKKNRTEST